MGPQDINRLRNETDESYHDRHKWHGIPLDGRCAICYPPMRNVAAEHGIVPREGSLDFLNCSCPFDYHRSDCADGDLATR